MYPLCIRETGRDDKCQGKKCISTRTDLMMEWGQTTVCGSCNEIVPLLLWNTLISIHVSYFIVCQLWHWLSFCQFISCFLSLLTLQSFVDCVTFSLVSLFSDLSHLFKSLSSPPFVKLFSNCLQFFFSFCRFCHFLSFYHIK